jgi:hypothetical protein
MKSVRAAFSSESLAQSRLELACVHRSAFSWARAQMTVAGVPNKPPRPGEVRPRVIFRRRGCEWVRSG